MTIIKCQIFLPSPSGLFSNSIHLTLFAKKKTRVLHLRKRQLAIVHLEKEKRLKNRRTHVEQYKSFSVCVNMRYKMSECNISRKKGDKIPYWIYKWHCQLSSLRCSTSDTTSTFNITLIQWKYGCSSVCSNI
jgi:hypothetical protein